MELEGSLSHLQRPHPVPILSLLGPGHILTSHFPKIPYNIILPSTPGSYKWSLSLRFPHQNTVYASPLHHTCYMPRPSHCSLFYHPNNTWGGVQIIKLLVIQFSLLLCYLVPLRPKYSPLHTILKHLHPTFLPQYERPCFTLILNNRQNYSSVHFNLYIFG